MLAHSFTRVPLRPGCHVVYIFAYFEFCLPGFISVPEFLLLDIEVDLALFS